MQLTKYLALFNSADDRKVMLYSTRRCSLVRLDRETLEQISRGEHDPETCNALASVGIMVDDLDREREEIRVALADALQRTARFSLTLLLNLDCNLACPYCFEDNFRHRQYMGEETARKILDQLLLPQMQLGRAVHLDFYGGEPLLSLPMLKNIASTLFDASLKHGVEFSFDIYTNGTLVSRSTVEELLSLGLRALRMTIDGPKEVHNRQRPFVSGKGSFDLVVANLKAVYELVAVQIGANFSAENWREFPKMLDHLLAAGVKPQMLDVVHFSPIMPKSGAEVGGNHGGHCMNSTEPWLMEAVLSLREEAIRRGFPVAKVKSSACVVDFDNDFVVNYDGTFYKCPIFMGYPELSVGTIETGIIDYSNSHALDRWKCDDCLDCPYLPICYGGCRFFAMQRGGTVADLDCRREYFDAMLEKLILQEQRLGS
ncbi:MAG: geopeptide radical SAM maturase [Geobacteraceae bacterium]|nr:geopeptide radical SAM maturase [Geobacteraceae bacterium]